MAYLTNANRMLWCYDNHVRPAEVTAVTGTNLTADTNFPLDNLKYDNPQQELRVSTTSASNRIITFQFGAAAAASCLGICNHDLMTRGYETITVEYSSNGSSWTNVGTGSVTLFAVYGDPNFFVRFDRVAGQTWWRLTLGKASGTRPAFRIGMVFVGETFEVTRNPLPGQYIGRKTATTRIVDTMGGARWLAPSGTVVHEEGEISFRRAPLNDFRFVEGKLMQQNNQRIVGIVQPEQLAFQMPIGQQHFFGYVTDAIPAAQDGPDSSSHKTDYTVAIVGAQ